MRKVMLALMGLLSAGLVGCGGGGGASNQPPVASAGRDQAVLAGATVVLDGVASSDSDGRIASYRWTQIGGDDVALSGASTAQVSFATGALTTDQTLQFQLSVTDDKGSANSDTVSVDINAAEPAANAGGDQTVMASGVVRLDGSASVDSGGAVTSYLWRQTAGPEGAEIIDADSAQTVVSLPPLSADSLFTFELTVSDRSGETAVDTVDLTINLATPVAQAGGDQTIGERRSVFLDGSGSGDVGSSDPISYLWTQNSGPVVSLVGAATNMARFVAPAVAGAAASPAELVFELTVTDSLGASSGDTVSVAVTNTLIAPIADAGASKTLDSTDANVTPLATILAGDESSDPDGIIVSYRWEQVSAPVAGVVLSNADQANATVTVDAELAEDSELFFRLTVTDDEEQRDSDTVKLTVLAPAPVVSEYKISGVISVAAASQLDSDVNDRRVIPVANDTVAIAQQMPSPSIIGGYVNQPIRGSDGNSFDDGDLHDSYRITLLEGQSVLLLIGSRIDADLDLWLYSLDGEVVDSSLSASSNESVVAPADGEYVVDVEAWSGFSNYNLAVGLHETLASNGYRLSDPIVVNQAIVGQLGDVVAKRATKEKTSGYTVLRSGGGSALYQLPSPVVASFRGALLPSSRAAMSAEQAERHATLVELKRLVASGIGDYAHPNYRISAQATPNDPRYSQQWHYPLINLDLAWDIATDVHPTGARVAVIDTGSLPDHPDMAGQFTGGYDFISDISNSGDGDGIDSDPTDPGDGGGSASSFHGTHVAGTIAASTNNNLGVSGVSWKTGTKIVPLRVLGEFGGTSYDVAQAVRYASGLDNVSGTVLTPAVDIINLSLGGMGVCSADQQAAFDAARAAGVMVSVAAGNDSSNANGFAPANCDGIYTVSAVDPDLALAWYSNYGDTVEVAAPGGDTSRDRDGDGYPDGVLSTLADDTASVLQYEYSFYQGTSMAAPHFAGVLALMRSANPLLTPAHIDAMLAGENITDDIGAAGRDTQFGWGLINARKAVAAAIDIGADPPPALLTVSPSRVNFGSSYTESMLTARNAGGGDLTVSSVSSSDSWLTIVAPGSTDGLGGYLLRVSREGLAEGSYVATVTFESSSNRRVVEVAMLVQTADFLAEVGPIYALLVNNSTEEVVAELPLTALEGQYAYSFVDVPVGSYRILAGSDFDNDLYICDAGEACGRYQTRSNPTVVTLVDADLRDIDFSVEYEVSIAAGVGGASTDSGQPRQKKQTRRQAE